MDTLLKADIFFFIAAIAAAIWGVLGIVGLVFGVKIMRDVRGLARTARLEASRFSEDMETLRARAGYGIAWLEAARFFWKMWKRIKRRNIWKE